MVTRGTVLTFYVDGDVRESILNSISDHTGALRSNALSALQGTGLTVEECTITSDEVFYNRTWTYRATMRVRTASAFNDLADVVSIVKGAFWQAADVQPARVSTTPPSTPDPTANSVPWKTLSFAVIALAIAVVVVKLT